VDGHFSFSLASFTVIVLSLPYWAVSFPFFLSLCDILLPYASRL
jgi:hypothetical protein